MHRRRAARLARYQARQGRKADAGERGGGVDPKRTLHEAHSLVIGPNVEQLAAQAS